MKHSASAISVNTGLRSIRPEDRWRIRPSHVLFAQFCRPRCFRTSGSNAGRRPRTPLPRSNANCREREEDAEAFDCIVESSSTMITAFEKRVDALESEKLLLAATASRGVPGKDLCQEFFELAISFLANPCKLWDKGDFVPKKNCAQTGVSEHAAHDPKTGLRTPRNRAIFQSVGCILRGKGWCTQHDSNVRPLPSEGNALSS